MLNTAVADVLSEMADLLEKADDFDATLHNLIKETYKKHKRIIFNGNGYDDAWVEEAEKRGLYNLKSTPDALPYSVKPENIALFERQHVLNKEEVLSRYEINMEEYTKIINIEALTMLDMAKKDILPSVSRFTKTLLETISSKKALGIDASYEEGFVQKISSKLKEAYTALEDLDSKTKTFSEIEDFEKASFYVRDEIIPAMDALREPCDVMETLTDASEWPFPTYGKLLYGIM